MPFLVPDIPQYVVAAPASAVVGVHVASGTNWDLGTRLPETPVSRLPDPEPVEVPSATELAAKPDGCSVRPVIYFAFNSSTTSVDALQSSFGALSKKCVWSAAGYTDPVGGARYNQRLGLARASFVAKWLGAAGYKVGVVHSFGKTGLVTADPDDYLFDRRVQVEAIPSAN